MRYATITARDDAPLAALIRRLLSAHGLDIPGTAYYDEALDHLSAFYLADPARRAYIVAREDAGEDGAGKLLGGAGLAECALFPDCAELQKLYVSEDAQGRGLGTELVRRGEQEAVRPGCRRIYLETHTNLGAALHLYEKLGYRRIERPAQVVHSTMNRFYLKELG